jgi:ATP-dependent DNA helicase DinG
MDPVNAFFEPGGDLSRCHPHFEHRPGQQAMARTVARVLGEGGNVMIEAGTGTGKTLAYLVPALMQDRRVIVSTGTRNLQDQIHDKDLPFLAGQAGFEVSACVMKGRDNYLCRYRMGQFEREPLLEKLDEADWVPRIAEWSRRTTTGDRAEIAELPDNLRLWRDVNARSDTCGGSRCPEYETCWLTSLKRRAQECQLIVVNHHLFFADLALRSAYGAVLPDYDTVIFDEAHLLEEIATLYFGVQVSSAQIEELARHTEKLSARHEGPAKGGGGAAQLRDAAREFFLPLRDRLGVEVGRARFAPVDRGGPDLEAEWASLCEALDELVRCRPPEVDAEEGGESLPRRVEELRASLSQVLDRSQPTFVYGMELRGRVNVTLSASPIDVSGLLRDNVFDCLHAAVLTSATLSVDGKFDFFRARLGLDDTDGTVVESSFDYEKQALLYLPRGMPEPRHPGFIDSAVEELSRLLAISEGRAFLLFTSFANLHRVRDALEALDRWPLFVQGDGSKAALVDSFRSTPRAVLLGTTSFWHGVDVPGEALSAVIVDKLPFDVPSDPLVAARIERIRDQDGNPFFEYQVPLAVLELKQGLGRLLRSTSDRGMVGVLDSRVSTRRYGKIFLRSLPPYRIVRNLDECRHFFEQTGAPGDDVDA